jgi:N-acetylmuramoyl-L-alanine amidase
MSRTKTDFIVIHCTATPEGRQFTVPEITAMHKARGFSTIGYHYLIGVNGETWPGRSPDNSIGAGVAGHNYNTLHVSYVGGVDARGNPKDTRTAAQKAAMKKLVAELQAKYPHALVLGHRDLSPDKDHDGVVEPSEWVKACPCFSARTWARENGLKAAPGEPEVKVAVASDDVAYPAEAFA